MKTTIEIADPLLDEAKRVAARDGETLRSLMEQGLRKVLAERKARRGAFKLRDASFKGEGLQAAFEGASWEQWRSAIYEGHGG